MASIQRRGKKYCVVCSYVDENNHRKQRWETFATKEDAKHRQTEIDYQKSVGSFIVTDCKTLSDLIEDYVSLYGKAKWSLSAYTSNMGLIKHYIEPVLGNMKLQEITPRVLSKYYQQLLKTPAVKRITDQPGRSVQTERKVSASTVRKIHNLLHSMFTQGEKWEVMERNPARLATVPENTSQERAIWDAKTLFKALSLCEDERLHLCINLAFACSLRLGELLALTWDCVEITDEQIAAGTACIHVTKELQRVNKATAEALEDKGIFRVFPEQGLRNTTILVLKKPKTDSSIRRVFLPKTVAHMLVEWKMEQDALKEALGNDYMDYDLVIASSQGMPVEGNQIRKSFSKLIKDNNLPPVVFHSLRHSSITYKLRLSGGDIKSVQGDSGHSQAQMVTDKYSHILDDDRQNNAILIEEAFYGATSEESIQEEPKPVKVVSAVEDGGISAETLTKLLANPEIVSLLKTLTKSL